MSSSLDAPRAIVFPLDSRMGSAWSPRHDEASPLTSGLEQKVLATLKSYTHACKHVTRLTVDGRLRLEPARTPVLRGTPRVGPRPVEASVVPRAPQLALAGRGEPVVGGDVTADEGVIPQVAIWGVMMSRAFSMLYTRGCFVHLTFRLWNLQFVNVSCQV